MKSIKISAILFIITILLVFNNVSIAKENITFRVDYLASEEGIPADVKSVYEKLTDKLIAKGFKKEDKAEWRVLINVLKADNDASDDIILAYTLSRTLPEPIIDFCAENEVFYLTVNEKDKKEGKNKQIRRYMTSEYMHQFSMLMDNKMYIIKRSNLDSELDKVAEEINKQIRFVDRSK